MIGDLLELFDLVNVSANDDLSFFELPHASIDLSIHVLPNLWFKNNHFLLKEYDLRFLNKNLRVCEVF